MRPLFLNHFVAAVGAGHLTADGFPMTVERYVPFGHVVASSRACGTFAPAAMLFPPVRRRPNSPGRGKPDPKQISTSFAKRQNLTMRMHMRRFTRLTNGFIKKAENYAHMVARYTVWYNFVRIHKTLRVTPAMAASVRDRP